MSPSWKTVISSALAFALVFVAACAVEPTAERVAAPAEGIDTQPAAFEAAELPERILSEIDESPEALWMVFGTQHRALYKLELVLNCPLHGPCKPCDERAVDILSEKPDAGLPPAACTPPPPPPPPLLGLSIVYYQGKWYPISSAMQSQ